jgi:hypothetical protein
MFYTIGIGGIPLPKTFTEPVKTWGQGHKDPMVKTPWCAFVCGNITNPWKFW